MKEEGTQHDRVADTIVNVVNKTVCKPYEKRGKVRSQTQALSQLSASINRLADISAKRLKAEVEDRATLLKFRKEEAEVNRKHEIELARLYLRQNQDLPSTQSPGYLNNSYLQNQPSQGDVRNLSEFPQSPPWNNSFTRQIQYESHRNMVPHSQIYNRNSFESDIPPNTCPDQVTEDRRATINSVSSSPIYYKM